MVIMMLHDCVLSISLIEDNINGILNGGVLNNLICQNKLNLVVIMQDVMCSFKLYQHELLIKLR